MSLFQITYMYTVSYNYSNSMLSEIALLA